MVHISTCVQYVQLRVSQKKVALNAHFTTHFCMYKIDGTRLTREKKIFGCMASATTTRTPPLSPMPPCLWSLSSIPQRKAHNSGVQEGVQDQQWTVGWMGLYSSPQKSCRKRQGRTKLKQWCVQLLLERFYQLYYLLDQIEARHLQVPLWERKGELWWKGFRSLAPSLRLSACK